MSNLVSEERISFAFFMNSTQDIENILIPLFIRKSIENYGRLMFQDNVQESNFLFVLYTTHDNPPYN